MAPFVQGGAAGWALMPIKQQPELPEHPQECLGILSLEQWCHGGVLVVFCSTVP